MPDDTIKKIGILGAGGQADEAEAYLHENQEVAFQAVSKEYLDNSKKNLIDIESLNFTDTAVVAAVGAPALRKDMINQWQGSTYYSIIADQTEIDKNTTLGKGVIIAPGVVITTNVSIGNHTIININASVSHDCKIGNFVTISPGVNIAGKVVIGDGVFIGIGAVISNNIRIAAGSVIGAGTVVLENITNENSVVVGVPGKVIRMNEEWLREI